MIKHSNRPFFSIIVPVYNVEKYLHDCVYSVINQTFQDFELILVDDGSTDSSGKICDDLEYTYSSKIRIYHKKNEGQLATRHFGFEKSNGYYILYLDSDDMLRNDALELIHDSIIKWKVDLVLFSASRKSDFSKKWQKINLPENEIISPFQLHSLFCSGTSLNNMVLKCFKSSCYPFHNSFEEFYKVLNGEDALQSMFLLDNVLSAVFINENLYFYRYNENSITNTYQSTYFDSISTFGFELREHVIKWGNKDILMPLVYQRNLMSCVMTIKEIVKKSNDKYLIQKECNKVKNSKFFISSIENGDISDMNLLDKLIIKSCLAEEMQWLRMIYFIISYIRK